MTIPSIEYKFNVCEGRCNAFKTNKVPNAPAEARGTVSMITNGSV